MSHPRFYALVPAAGIGERSGAGMPKQYVPLAGRPILAHTLAALGAVPRLTQTLVVLSPADDRFEAALPGCPAWVARVGGASRAESVLGGLAELRRRGAADEDWVLVHDAARCLLQPAWVDALIDACANDAVGGLLAQPVADTLKAGDAAGRVTATVDRRDKWAAQTPQMFRLGLVEQALTAVGAAATDEASAVEALGLAPRLVRASMANFKVTWPEDFALAERLLGFSEPGMLRPVPAEPVDRPGVRMQIRAATREDAPGMSQVLQDIVAATGRQRPTDVSFVVGRYLADPTSVRCVVAVDASGAICGFQSLKKAQAGNPYDTPEGWGIVGTHISPRVHRQGVGTQLFAATLEAARQAGLPKIDAYIGADNPSALKYYEAMGFRTYRTREGIVQKACELAAPAGARRAAD